jgi:hypothetical protein
MLTDSEHSSNMPAIIMLEPGGAMIVDYDFTLGKQRLRGVGWRGLVALGITLIIRAAMLSVIVISAKSASDWLPRLIEILFAAWAGH